MSQSNDKPIHRISSGALSVSIWEKQSGDKMFYTTSAQRAFTRDDGKTWEYSDSFNRDDLPVVALLYQSAWAWIRNKEAK